MMRRCCGEYEHGTWGVLWVKYSLKRLCSGRSRASRLCSHDIWLRALIEEFEDLKESRFL